MAISLPTRLYAATHAYLQATREGQATAAFMERNRAALIAGIFTEAASVVAAKRGLDDELPPAAEVPDWFAGLRSKDTPLLDQVERAATLVNKFYLEGQGLTGSMRAMAASIYGFELVRHLMSAEGLKYPAGWEAANQTILRVLQPQTSKSVLTGSKESDGSEVGTNVKDATAYFNGILDDAGIRDRVTVKVNKVGERSWVRWDADLFYKGQKIEHTMEKTRRASLQKLANSWKFWPVIGKQVLAGAGYRDPRIVASKAGAAQVAQDDRAAAAKGRRDSAAYALADKLFAEQVTAFLAESQVGAKVVEQALADAEAKGRVASIRDVKRHLPEGWRVTNSGGGKRAAYTLRGAYSWHWYSQSFGSGAQRALRALLSTLKHYASMSVADYLKEHARRRGGYMMGPQKPTHSSSYTLEDVQDSYKTWTAQKPKRKPVAISKGRTPAQLQAAMSAAVDVIQKGYKDPGFADAVEQARSARVEAHRQGITLHERGTPRPSKAVRHDIDKQTAKLEKLRYRAYTRASATTREANASKTAKLRDSYNEELEHSLAHEARGVAITHTTTAKVGGLTIPVEHVDMSKLGKVKPAPYSAKAHPDLYNWLNNVVKLKGGRKLWVVVDVSGDAGDPTLELVALSGGNKGSETRVTIRDLAPGLQLDLLEGVSGQWFAGQHAEQRRQKYVWKVRGLYKHGEAHTVGGSAGYLTFAGKAQ